MTRQDKSIVQRGLWFEEFETGVRYQHRPGRTITEADNVLFTTLTMNTQALHLDAAFSDALPPFNQRLVNSMFTLSTLVGLSVAQLTQGTIVGNLGFGEVAFPKPLFHGDTLYAETEVTDKRESKSGPGEGIVTFAHTGRNQHGDIVATASRKTMVRKRPSGRRIVALTSTGPGWLFCPADRPERFEKAAAAADVVILDLEDGVAAKDREAAREALIDTPLDPTRTVVRVNPVATPDHAPDLEALARHRVHDGDAGEDRGSAAGSRSWRRWTSSCSSRRRLGALMVTETGARRQRVRRDVGRRGSVRGDRRHREPVARRQLSRRRQARPVADVVGGKGVRADGAGFGVPRHQGPRRAACRGRRRRRGRLRRQGRDPSDPGGSHPRRPTRRPTSRWPGRDGCSTRRAANEVSSNSRA